MPETVGDRVRAVRERRGEKQPEFARTLTAAAKHLKVDTVYDNTMVSKMEVGRRDVDLSDVTVIASVDPERRSREWLAWGEEGQILLDPRKDRGLSAEEEQRAVSKAAAAQAKRPGKGAAAGTRRKA